MWRATFNLHCIEHIILYWYTSHLRGITSLVYLGQNLLEDVLAFYAFALTHTPES
jgi:hypothetical protein